MRVADAVPQLAALAPLHDDVDVCIIFVRPLELRNIQAAAQPAHHLRNMR